MTPHRTPISRGQMSLALGTTLAFANINTYEKVIGTWGDGFSNNFVISDANDRITYTGGQTMCFLFNGTADAAGGLSKIWYCNNLTNYSDSDFSNYTLMGYLPRTDGYIKESILGEILPSNTVGGGSTTFFCDYAYVANLPASSTVLRGVYFGGSAHSGALAGFGFVYTHYAPSNALASVGSRLCFLGA